MPFAGETVLHLMVSISDEAHANPSSLAPALPKSIDAWFARALHKQAEMRFDSLEEMVAAFRAATSAAPSRRALPKRVIVLAALSSLGLGLLIILWMFVRSAPATFANEGSASAPALDPSVTPPPATVASTSAAPNETTSSANGNTPSIANGARTPPMPAASAAPQPRRRLKRPSEIQ